MRIYYSTINILTSQDLTNQSLLSTPTTDDYQLLMSANELLDQQVTKDTDQAAVHTVMTAIY